MKNHIHSLIKQALLSLQADNLFTTEKLPNIQIEHTKNKQHGDFATNIAMTLAKTIQSSPRDVANKIKVAIPHCDLIENIEIAGPGFINFYLTKNAQNQIIEEILLSKENFGQTKYGNNETINLEFISANPTGPLHVGHGRSAAYGTACSNLLSAIGYNVHREYYVNDAGRQTDILATSTWLRYLNLCGEQFSFPSSGYQGDYIVDIAKQLKQQHGDALHWPANSVFKNVPPDHDNPEGDKEAHIDALIKNCKNCLGETGYSNVHKFTLDTILTDIKNDLAEFGVEFDKWFLESHLFDGNYFANAMKLIKEKNVTYEKDGCLWFKATQFGDDKDRVLIRKNGYPTYFAADIANHLAKLERNADHLIDIFGSDHHGYVTRLQAALTGVGITEKTLKVVLIQFVTLYRGKERVPMSTRSGSFVSLRELRKEVGNDAARFFYILRKAEQHLDFDLELATKQTSDNPIYYIQYAHARICSVFNQLTEKNWQFDQALGLSNVNLLLEPQEKDLIFNLSLYAELLHTAAMRLEPHLIAYYLKDLANSFHTYYNSHQFLIDHEATRNARLCLVAATKQIIANGLQLLGVSAPEEM